MKHTEIVYKKPFKLKSKTYRLIAGLLVDELQVKRGSRYEHVSYVANKEDAMNVINNKPRNLEGFV